MGISIDTTIRKLSLQQRVLVGLFTVILLVVSYYFWGEKLGLGFDGVVYGDISLHFWPYFLEKKITDINLLRSIPSVIAYLIVMFFRMDKTPESVILVFNILNSFCLIFSFYYFWNICKKLDFKPQRTALAFVFVFISYFPLKQMSYYPVLTDGFGFLLGLGSFYYYLTGAFCRLGLVALVSAFTWPGAFLISLTLMFFPKNTKIRLWPKVIPYFQNFCVFMLMLCFFYMLDRLHIRSHSDTNFLGLTPINRNVFFISVTLFLVTYILMLKEFFQWIFPERPLVPVSIRVQLVSLGVFVVIALLKNAVVRFGIHSEPMGFVLLSWMFNQPLVRPFSSMVAHLIYFGPAVLLLFVNLRAIVSHLKYEGIGLQILFASSLFLTMDSESRHLVHCVPALMILLVAAMVREPKIKGVIVFAVVQFIFSRVWLPVGANWNTNEVDYSRFPWQGYFMNFGPWVNQQVYLVFLIIGLCSLPILLRISRRLWNN